MVESWWTCSYSYIFKARYASGDWHYQDLDFLDNTYFRVVAWRSTQVATFTATTDCGTNNSGTVWQVSP